MSWLTGLLRAHKKDARQDQPSCARLGSDALDEAQDANTIYEDRPKIKLTASALSDEALRDAWER